MGQKVETVKVSGEEAVEGGPVRTGGVNRPGWFRAFSWCSSSPMVGGGFKALCGTLSKSVKLRDLLTCKVVFGLDDFQVSVWCDMLLLWFIL